MTSYKEYRDTRLTVDPERKEEYDALGPEYERYQESLARSGEPVPLEAVENLDVREDARALEDYAKEHGVSTMNLT